MIKYGIILLMLCLWQSKNADAMPPMKYLGIEQGLSNNMVTCITQDSYGFMWMGTYDGLDRYDGSQFKIFRNLWGAENSLVNNHVKAITAVNNKIFVGTRGGLMYYDYSDSRFHALYYLPAESHRAVKLRSVVNQIVADHTGAIYVTTDDLGLLKFEKSDSIGRQLNYHNKRLPVQAIAIDKANRVWLFMNGIGLCRYDSQKITLINNTISSANCLLSDQHSRIWIGTNNGLYTYTPDSRLLLKFDETRAKLSSENIFSLSLTQRQEIWVATNGDGINIWNERTGKLTYLKAGETARSLRSGAVKAVYEDGEKRKWIATLRGGVNIIDDHIMPFHVFTHNALNKNSVVNNFILSFCEDENHDIWIGTDGGGMSHWDSRKNTFTSYVHQPGPGSLSSNFVVSMVNDYTHKLWVATFGGGIDAMDKATGHFKHYTCYNPGLKAEEKNLWKLYEDHQRHLWASATWNGALYLLNRARDQFELFDKRLI
ncbi:MAG: two-component regulator propeller domain-containing protein, partial [Mucilaginibacter sp.]